MPITFDTKEDANEFESNSNRPVRIWKEGSVWKGEFTNKRDVKKAKDTIKRLDQLEDELDEKEERLNVIREASGGGVTGTAKRTLKGIVKGLNAFNENVKNPSKRMRIAKTPGNRREVPIANNQIKARIAPNAGLKRHGNISTVPRDR